MIMGSIYQPICPVNYLSAFNQNSGSRRIVAAIRCYLNSQSRLVTSNVFGCYLNSQSRLVTSNVFGC